MLQITPQGMKLVRAALAGAWRDPWLQRGKITLAGSAAAAPYPKQLSPQRRLEAKRRERMTTNCETILGRGTASAFEFEASCRHGIRRALCTEGWRWDDADSEAAKVVSAALTRIGATRPTHWQGQPQNEWGDFIERRLCVHCCEKIPDIRKLRGAKVGKSVRFCSETCAGAEQNNRTMAEWLAFASSKKEHTKTLRMKDCEHCGELFLPTGDAKKYCSIACNGLAQRAIRQPIPCPQCQLDFVPSKARQVYCSNACVVASKVTHEERACQQCGYIFKPDSGSPGMFCSNACRGQSMRKPRPEATCQWCSSIFTARTSWIVPKYCSRSCVARARNASMRGIICEAVS